MEKLKNLFTKENLKGFFKKNFFREKKDSDAFKMLHELGLFGDNTDENIERNLICNIDPRSIVVEQYRNLRNQILSEAREKKLKIFSITSSVRGEGKTTICSNLAISFAMNPDNSVIVIDADLRSPSLHKFFGLSQEEGLREFLEGKIEFERCLKETFNEKIKIITSGEKPSNPAELLSSSRMVKLLEDLRRDDKTNFVFIDTPPVIPATEPRVLGEIADATIFVVQANSTGKDLISLSLSFLSKIEVLGVVLNNMVGLSSYYPYYYPDIYGYE